MEACQVCQFENHLRAVTGLPLAQPGFHSPAAMVNLLGQASGATALEGLDHALSNPGFSLHLYGKPQCRPGRKMGHFTVTGATATGALETARRISDTLKVTGALT
jgi:5-(carboxyamino)imidazole ribonucleotide synthase